MASARAKFTVGLFVAGGISIALVALIWLGLTRYFEKGRHYVSYFNESVQGLDADSPVKYRGVPVGRVERIGVAPDSKLIEVLMKIESDQELESDIVAQLKVVGITGSMFIELDRRDHEESDRAPDLSFPTEYPIIPSRPSGIMELLSGIDQALQHLNAIDFQGISEGVKLTMSTLNATITDIDAKGISQRVTASLDRINAALDQERLAAFAASLEESGESLKGLLSDARGGVQRLDGVVERVDGLLRAKEEAIAAAIDQVTAAAAGARALMENGALLTANTEDRLQAFQSHLMASGRNLERASRSLSELLEILRHQPSQLLFSGPPEPRQIDEESR